MRTTGKSVVIPLHPDLRQALEEAQAWPDTNLKGQDYILPAIARRSQYNPSGIQKDVMKVIRCATGLDTNISDTPGKRILKANLYSLHSFRHTFVSFCANVGVSLDIVAEVVGHGSPVMTRHYAHISDTAQNAILNALPSQQPKEETNDDDTPGNASKAELMEKLSKLSPDKIDKLLKVVAEEVIGQSRRKTPWKLPLQSEKLGYGITFIGELSLPDRTAILTCSHLL